MNRMLAAAFLILLIVYGAFRLSPSFGAEAVSLKSQIVRSTNSQANVQQSTQTTDVESGTTQSAATLNSIQNPVAESSASSAPSVSNEGAPSEPRLLQPPLKTGDAGRDQAIAQQWLETTTTRAFGENWDQPTEMQEGSWQEILKNEDGSSQASFLAKDGSIGRQWILPDGTVGIEELEYPDGGKLTRFLEYGEDRENIVSWNKGREGFDVRYHSNGQKKNSAYWHNDQIETFINY